MRVIRPGYEILDEIDGDEILRKIEKLAEYVIKVKIKSRDSHLRDL